MDSQIKAPLVESLILFMSPNPMDKVRAAIRMRMVIKNMSLLPEPTKENTEKQNSHILIDIRDEFLFRFIIAPRINPLRAIFNFIIIVYEYDEPYEQLSDWVVSKLFARRDDWLPIQRSKPDIKIWKQDWQLEEEAAGETDKVD